MKPRISSSKITSRTRISRLPSRFDGGLPKAPRKLRIRNGAHSPVPRYNQPLHQEDEHVSEDSHGRPNRCGASGRCLQHRARRRRRCELGRELHRKCDQRQHPLLSRWTKHCAPDHDCSGSTTEGTIMIQKLVTVALVGTALALAACNTVRGAASDVNSVANCTENA